MSTGGAATRTPRATSPSFAVGDVVELRDAPLDTVGTIVAVVHPDHARVAWNTGEACMGKTTLLSTRVLRRRVED